MNISSQNSYWFNPNNSHHAFSNDTTIEGLNGFTPDDTPDIVDALNDQQEDELWSIEQIENNDNEEINLPSNREQITSSLKLDDSFVSRLSE